MEPVFQELYDFPEEASTVTFPPVSDGAWRAARRRPVPLASLRPSVSATFTFFFFFPLDLRPSQHMDVKPPESQQSVPRRVYDARASKSRHKKTPSPDKAWGGRGGGRVYRRWNFPGRYYNKSFHCFLFHNRRFNAVRRSAETKPRFHVGEGKTIFPCNLGAFF